MFKLISIYYSTTKLSTQIEISPNEPMKHSQDAQHQKVVLIQNHTKKSKDSLNPSEKSKYILEQYKFMRINLFISSKSF